MKNILLLLACLTMHQICHAQAGTWTWVKGDSTYDMNGYPGVRGVPDSANYPSARYGATQWTDLQGNFWMFGGVNSLGQVLNDLWRFSPTTDKWTFMSGTFFVNLTSSYGTQGVAAPGNMPGGRTWAISLTDTIGRLWMYGGSGYDGGNIWGSFDDMWMYDIASGQWTWVKGSNAINRPPVFGTKMVSATSNSPGSRAVGDAAWTRSDGSLWVFGGNGAADMYNDMWRYDIADNNWTWMSGSDTTHSDGSYGIRNQESPSNLPPARSSYSHWKDRSGNFYIFGGATQRNAGLSGYYTNEVWRYNSNNNEWTWLTGDTAILNYSQGDYTQYCQPGNGARPSNRSVNRTAQTNGCPDIFWTFGGNVGMEPGTGGNPYYENDLWNFNPRTHEWTWMSGHDPGPIQKHYGTMNVPSAANMPPPRGSACLWADNSGAIWMWGGLIDDIRVYGLIHTYNDMWRFVVDSSCAYDPLPELYISDTILCIGDTAHIRVDNGSFISISPVAGLTLTDSMHAIISPTNPQVYTFITGRECRPNDTLSALINPVTHFSTTGQALSICTGDSFVYGSHIITVSGTYVDSLRSRFGCDSIVTRTISVLPLSYAAISRSMCDGDSLFFGGAALHAAGTYQDTLRNAAGCDSIITLTLITHPLPVSGFSITSASDTIPLGDVGVTNTSIGADSVLWLLNDQVITLVHDSLVHIDSDGNYCIRLISTSAFGCTDTSRQCIYVFGGDAFAMPNAFTPNGDGKNDLFYPVFIHKNTATVVSFSIYNRWGQSVYTDPTKGWDGSCKGEPQPGGIYSYYITVDLPDKAKAGVMREIKREGNFALIR